MTRLQTALAGFLAGCSGLTRLAYALDLCQWASWCHQHYIVAAYVAGAAR